VRVAIVLAVALAAGAADAAEYLVQPGDSLEQLAEQLYGDRQRAELLAAANGLGSGRAELRAGERLLVPMPERRTVAGQETWETLARRWLGDERRAFLLIEHNQGRPEVAPVPGSTVGVPAVVAVRVGATTNVGDIAERVAGHADAVRLIRRFNLLTQNRVARGDVVLVPVPDLQLTTVGTAMVGPTEPAAPAPPRTVAGARAEGAARQLEAQLRDGLYVEVIETAARLLGQRPSLSRRDLVSILQALGTAYVALDREPQAIAVFREALQHQPDLAWNPITTSPKVLRVWDAARGVNAR